MINANVISNFYEKYLRGAIYCIVLKKIMLINVNGGVIGKFYIILVVSLTKIYRI